MVRLNMKEPCVSWRQVAIWLLLREKFADLRKAFQVLSRLEQDIFLMAQLKVINGGEITASRRLKKKTRTNKRSLYY